VIRVVFYGISSLDRNINLIIGTLLLTIIVGFEGVLMPFKIKNINYQGLVFMFNLQCLFVVLLYNQNISYFVNVMITLALVHLFTIITHNFFRFVCNSNKMVSRVLSIFKGWLSNLASKRQIVHQQEEIPLRSIPADAFNYSEFQEPLIVVD